MLKLKIKLPRWGWIKEVAEEVRHISWPTKHELALYLLAVLALSAIITAYIYGLDSLFNKLHIYWINK